MISTVILTKNEEQDLPLCLDALQWCDDVHVLDSGSEDLTVEVACSYGAKVSMHAFESFGKQRNHALQALPLRHEWVLFLDADEVMTPACVQAVQQAVQQAPESVAGFYMCWKMMLEDTWLKHSDSFPKWQFRLLRKGRATFTDFGHGQKEGDVDGSIAYIREPYLHYSYSKGWHQWVSRHNHYSDKEALARLHNCPPFKQVFARHGSQRNVALKSWLSRLPAWPLLRFLHAYILKLGFLEGTPGLIYSVNMAYHEFLIQIKMRELKRKQKPQAIKQATAAHPQAVLISSV